MKSRAYRVLQVVEPGRDGVFRHVDALVRNLLSQGHVVALAYSSVRGSRQLDELVAVVSQARGEVIDLNVSNVPSLTDLRAYFQLASFVFRWRPNVIHAHSSKAGALARLLALLRVNVPLLYTPHAYYGMGKPSGAKAFFFNGVEKLLGKIGTTIHVSYDEADFGRKILGIKPARQIVIHNGVDMSLYSPSDQCSREAWRSARGLPADSIVLGTVGRFSEQKDPLTLYRAVSKAMGLESRLYFAHLGDGELRDSIEILVRGSGLEKRFIWTKFLSDPSKYYGGFDGFVLTSRYEGLSLATLEALACGLPLLLSDVPGNREFLRIGLSHCWSAPAGDADGFARIIEKWLESRVGEKPSNHRAVAVEQFDLVICCRRILDTYETVLNS